MQNLHISLKVSNFAHVKAGGRSLTNRPIRTLYAFPSMPNIFEFAFSSSDICIVQMLAAEIKKMYDDETYCEWRVYGGNYGLNSCMIFIYESGTNEHIATYSCRFSYDERSHGNTHYMPKKLESYEIHKVK